jgi:hypothetical protein
MVYRLFHSEWKAEVGLDSFDEGSGTMDTMEVKVDHR